MSRTVQPRTNVRLAGFSQHLLSQVQLRVPLTLRHIKNTGCFVRIRALGFRKRSYPVKDEVLSEETMFHQIGTRVFTENQMFLSILTRC